MNKFDEAIKLMEETAKLKGLRPARVARCYGLICQIYYSNKKDVDMAKKYYDMATKVPGGNWQSAYLRKKLGF